MRNTVLAATLGMLVLGAGSGVEAQAGSLSADQILTRAVAKYRALKDFSATLRYSLSGPKGRPLSRVGSIQSSKGRYAFKTGDQEVYSDGKTRWVYLTGNKEVAITRVDPKARQSFELAFNAAKLKGQRHFAGTVTWQGRRYYVVTITPTDSSGIITKMWVNTKSFIIERMELLDSSIGSKTTFEFRNIKLNQGLPASTFRFDPAAHPGTDVYDNR